MSFKDCPLVFTEFNMGDMEDDLKMVKDVAKECSKDIEVSI